MKRAVTIDGVDRKAESFDEWFRLWMMVWPRRIRKLFALPSYGQVLAVFGCAVLAPTAVVETAMLVNQEGRVEDARQAGEFTMAKRAELGVRGYVSPDDLPPNLRGAIIDQVQLLDDQKFRAEQAEQGLVAEKEARAKLEIDLAAEREQRLKADRESAEMRRILLNVTSAGAD